MLTSVRHALLRPSLFRSLSSTASTPPNASTSTTTTLPTLSTPSPQLADVMDSVEDAAVDPQGTKLWRIFRQGNIIRPSDLSREKCKKSRSTRRSIRTVPSAPVAQYNDVFRQLDLDPVDFTLNPYVMSSYISEMGKIYSRDVTGLTARSQRRLGKAIRRARMIGIIPQLSRPPRRPL